MAQDASSAGDMDSTHSIVQFLQRPVALGHVEIDLANPAASAPPLRQFCLKSAQVPTFKASLPGGLLALGGKRQKVANFEYFRADIKVKVVVNTNPFVGGRFFLTYAPYEQGNEVEVDQVRQQVWTSRAGVTAFPGVEIDLQIDNSVEIMVPYASYKEAYNLNVATNEDFVNLYLFNLCDMLVPQDSTGSLTFTFYAWFENIKLVIPTYKGLTMTQKIRTVQLSHIEKKKAEQFDQIQSLKTSNPAVYNYIMSTLNTLKNSAKPKFKSKREAEQIEVDMQIQAEAGSGIISSIAGTVKGVADVVGGIGIPVVSEIAGTVGWVSDVVGGIASIFGWSRPTDMERNVCYTNVPGKNYAHIEAVDEGVVLGLSAKNELEKPHDIFPSGIDEMSLDYVCANPGLKLVVPWNIASKGASLKALAVIPVGIGPYTSGMCKYTTGEGDDKVTRESWIVDTVPCEYVSQLFQYWRATMCYKISIVKTAFHTGRLEIFFIPGKFLSKDIPSSGYYRPDLTQYDNVNENSIQADNCYKYILDLTNDTEVTIRIPYVSDSLFRHTQGVYRDEVLNSGGSGGLIEDAVDNTYIGSLVIREVNPLICPSTVKQQVEVLVWKWAEEVVLNSPQTTRNKGLQIWDHRLMAPDAPCLDVEMQINVGTVASGNVVTFFDVASPNSTNLEALKMACGEQIVNLRSLLRAFRLAPFGGYKYRDNSFTPLQLDSGTPIVPNFQENTHGFDYLSYLSFMYRFFRGGYRLKLFQTSANKVGNIEPNWDGWVESWLTPVNFKNVVSIGVANRHEGPSHRTYMRLNPVHEISLPYYSQFRKLPISAIPDDAMMGIALSSTANMQFDMYRAGNDDFTYGWLMGTPQLFIGDIAVDAPSTSTK